MTQKHNIPTLPAARFIVTLIIALCMTLPIAALPADNNVEIQVSTSTEAGWFDQLWDGAMNWLTEIWAEDEDEAISSIHGQGERGPMVDPSGNH